MRTISIFIPWFSPAYKAGGPIQSIANLIGEFNKSISFKIFCSDSDVDGTNLDVQSNTWIKYNSNSEVYYAATKNRSIPLFVKEIKSLNTNVLFINGIYSWYFNLFPLLISSYSRKIVSVRGMLHPGALSQKPFKKKLYLFLWKTLRLHKKCDFHASNEEEKKYIEKVFGKKIKIFIAQNFPKIINRQLPPQKNPGVLKLISVALISPMKNHLLVLHALQFCTEHIAYNIYGAIKDLEYWQHCLKQIESLPVNISVKYHGDILPTKVESALSQSHVFILPSKSENFGHAFYEALSAGKPVITSGNTPWKNLKVSSAGINVSLENTNEIVDAIKCFAAMGKEEYNVWSLSANTYAAKSVNFEEIKRQYEEMFFA